VIPRLYLTEGHASFNDSTSAIGVFEPRLQESKCLDQIVRVTGPFSDIGGRDYGLVDIEKIQITEDSSYRIVDCWQRNH